ncbi:uncharacterized protein LOC121424967 [Lytechinus variegatus]|uniref:uncharacterized protein LOC121424967 n=1 Tax=Lytechinus variegatus TaxID=7654 RepID=UPI001BB1E3C9|nr:uncharacterized protein LOC121424967 [Lytechinus variegatus]XP_041476801.1 uncharacterized protein LOC121424967 [Lytechinus variegatus]
MEPGSIQHSGYLTPGDEINVQGGFTVNFQKKHRRFWTLQYFGEGNLILNGYKDEKSFRRSSSSSTNTKTSTLGRQRKLSSAPVDTIRLMTSLKVDKIEMKMRKKVENVLVIVSGSHPKFFRPDNKEALDSWRSAFMKFASDTRSIRRRPRKTPEQKSPDSSNLERDSGVSTSFVRSTRDSDRSSSSSVSSEEMGDEPSHRHLPTTMLFDIDDDDHNTSPLPSPTLREHAGRKVSRRQSIFFRNKDGTYEEMVGSRESTESGFYETTLHRNGNDDNRPESSYDVPSPSSSPRHTSAHNGNDHDTDDHVSPVRHLRKSKHSSSSLDSSIPEERDRDSEDIRKRLAESLGVENSPELQEILNDDGSVHTYINQRRHGHLPSSSSPLASPRVPARPPVLPPRKMSVSASVSDTEYQLHVVEGARRRAESMPIGGIDVHDFPDRSDYFRSSRVPIHEDIKPYTDIEALLAQQTRGEIEVEIDKADLVDSVALVDIKQKVIVAGWKRDIFGKLHVGDQLVQVNEQVVSQSEWANTFIKTSSKTKIVLHVNRLPFAKILNCTRIHEETLWGIECKGNEITHVRSGPVKESGLTEKSESSAFSNKTCDWIITEAANKPIRLNCPKDEMMQYLATKDLDLPLVVHPKDFIHDLTKALNKLKRSSFYHVG